MKRARTYLATHRKALTAAAVGLLTLATYAFGAQNAWVVAAGAVLSAAGVAAVPNRPTQPPPAT